MTVLEHRPGATSARPELRAVDHLEWWVGNARAFTAWLCSGFGFRPLAYAGPETGRPTTVSYVVEQGSVRFVITSGLTPDEPVASHVRLHGDGVHDIAFTVDDVDRAYDLALARGGTGSTPPHHVDDSGGELRTATLATYGDTVHTLIDRHSYRGVFAPQFVVCDLAVPVGPDVGVTGLDHTVANVEDGALDDWVGFYEQVFGFIQRQHFSAEQIATKFSALRSTVVTNGGAVVFPINEPAPGRKKSQIQEYLDHYRAPGVQHIALNTDDLLATVEALRARGVRFMDVPATYYEEVAARMSDLALPWDALAAQQILIDRDERGHLLQIFTEPVGDRPTVFFEIIQREGAEGFGDGNFKALFEAVERAQARRGNL